MYFFSGSISYSIFEGQHKLDKREIGFVIAAYIMCVIHTHKYYNIQLTHHESQEQSTSWQEVPHIMTVIEWHYQTWFVEGTRLWGGQLRSEKKEDEEKKNQVVHVL